MGIKTIAVLLHLVSSGIALITSETQTRRIIKEIKKFNIPALSILGGGLIAAIFGTFSILDKDHKMLRKLDEILRCVGK